MNSGAHHPASSRLYAFFCGGNVCRNVFAGNHFGSLPALIAGVVYRRGAQIYRFRHHHNPTNPYVTCLSTINYSEKLSIAALMQYLCHDCRNFITDIYHLTFHFI